MEGPLKNENKIKVINPKTEKSIRGRTIEKPNWFCIVFKYNEIRIEKRFAIVSLGTRSRNKRYRISGMRYR